MGDREQRRLPVGVLFGGTERFGEMESLSSAGPRVRVRFGG